MLIVTAGMIALAYLVEAADRVAALEAWVDFWTAQTELDRRRTST